MVTARQPDKFAIVAAGGRLPVLLAKACREAGRPFFVLALDGTDTDPDLAPFEGARLPLGAFGQCIARLQAEACTAVVMAGHLTRPNFSKLALDRKGLKLLPKLLRYAGRGDDALLRLVVDAVEQEGFTVMGADAILADLVVPVACLTKAQPSETHRRDIARGADVVRTLGALDIGQAAVVVEDLVLAVEAAEGTDAMLARCATLAPDLRGTADARRGDLVKLPKPGQDKRVDLPTIGPRTVEAAAAAGLAGIAVAGGATLLLDRTDAVAHADAHGLFLIGFADNADAS